MEAVAVRAMIVDDDEDMRELVRAMFELDGEIEMVGEEGDSVSGARRWAELRPDVLIVDYQLPGANGLDLAEWVLTQDADARILVFSAYLDEVAVARAHEIGVRELVAKERFRDLRELVFIHAPHH